ncbi:MAG: GNAT family N-acetyltransferase [Saprospiraceae bacterium]|nr:GNAT family N-acetyltransferase [Saprospiraceae bacterium]
METTTITNLIIHAHSPQMQPTTEEFNAISSFLFQSLEQYGDPLDHIQKAMRYALDMNDVPGQGGLVLSALDEEGNIYGAVVINATGMSEYIPENILVYIAVNPETRGMGLGKRLMQTAIETVHGGIALHVEPDNPARQLYENLGFTNKYLEMRYQV